MILTTIAFVLFGLTLSGCIYLWNKNDTLQNLYMDAVNRANRNTHEEGSLKSRNKALAEDLKQKESKITKLEKNIANYRAKLEDSSSSTENQKEQSAKTISELEGKYLHFKEQTEVLTKELMQLTEQQKSFKLEAQELAERKVNEMKAELETARKSLAEKMSEMKQFEKKVDALNKELNKKTEILKKVNPRDILVAKKRNQQNSKLINMIKGQKQMLEERNNNLEVALRKTSEWIIQKEKPQAQVPTELGPLLGTALETIGFHLIGDEHTEETNKSDVPPSPQTKPAPEAHA